MKTNLSCALCLAAFFLLFCGTSSRAEEWTTTDGKVYKEVSVVKVEPDAVTILHNHGGALVPMTKLPSEIQKRFGYDPVMAKAAADARAQAEAELLQAEEMANAALAAQNANVPTGPITSSYSAASRHSSMDDLTGSSSLLHDPNDLTHSSMDGLIRSNSLLHDPNDSRHSSMDSLVRG